MLIDLLKFLGSRIGEPVSKEDIVKRLWKEEYHPFQHDNKIYVTIKRLRKILEIDTTRPKYLICQSNGYFLQNGVRFTIERSGL